MKNTIDFLKNTLEKNITVVLGLSGGPDSMCLFHILLNLKEEYHLNIICAHVNHNVRKESEKEEQFVREFCEDNNCIFETIKLNIENKKNFEAKARKERYNFFESVVKKYNANVLMTAHHGDDLTETILMHLTRGSNLKGYAGFRKITDYNNYKLIRPLIYLTKDEIVEYCKKNNIKYCIDASNESNAFTRNRYRLHILPFLKQENKNVHKKFLKFSEELEMVEDYLAKTTQSALTRVYDSDKVNLHELNKLDLLLKKRVIEYILKEEYQDDISKLNDRHINLILKICTSVKPNISIKLPLNKTLVKEYNHLYFCNKVPIKSKEYILEDYLKLNENEEIIRISTTDIEKSNFIIRLNSKEISLPLKVRTKKEKDRIKIKNLNGTKKVKDIFINEKVPASKRDTYPIVVDSKDNIIWIPGLKKSEFDKNKEEFYDIIYKYVISEEQNYEK